MAEFAGSIIGIIAAGTKVAMVLSQLASDIGSAGQEARMISSEIRTFCTILNTLKDTTDKIEGSSYYAHCYNLMRGMTDASAEMFSEILDAAETLRSIASGKDRRDGKLAFVSKIQWTIFQKPKILVLRAAIEAYKSNIALMLGTINLVEKVARRTSLKNDTDAVVQDDQEQATLQSLELDCCSSILSLEQAEHEYKKYILQATDGPVASPIEDQVLGTVTKKDISTRKDRVLDSNQQQERLIDIAREGVNSIRSSLSSFPAEEGTLQAQITRHSQRLSRLMEMEQHKISQRMSQLRNSSVDNGAPSGPLESELPRDTFEGLQEAHCSSADYLQFRTWLLARPWRVQDDIMNTLKADVFSDRLPENLQKISNFHSTAHLDDWLRRVDKSSIASGRLQPDTDVLQALTVQEAIPRAINAPSRRAGPLQRKPFDHSFKNPVREAEDLLAPPPSIKNGAPDHRRSRSHDVSGHRDTGLHTYLTSTSRGSDEQQYMFNREAGYIPIYVENVHEAFSKSLHRPSAWRADTDRWLGSQTSGSANGLFSSTGPHANTANTLQSPLAKTSRKEKRYSMFVEKDILPPRAPPKFPLHASLEEYMESMGASFPSPTLYGTLDEPYYG